MSDWIGLPPDNEIDNWHGFVYKITRTNTDQDDPENPEPSIYIGCKKLHSVTKKKPSKKSGLTRNKKVTKRSDYLSYWGSSNELKESIKKHGKHNFKREIIHLCESQSIMKYMELVYQLVENALISEKYFNGICNIRIAKLSSKYKEKYEKLQLTMSFNK